MFALCVAFDSMPFDFDDDTIIATMFSSVAKVFDRPTTDIFFRPLCAATGPIQLINNGFLFANLLMCISLDGIYKTKETQNLYANAFAF